MKPASGAGSGRIVIETIDGRVFIGDSFREVVQAIRASAWACTENSLQAYMRGVARRANEWTKGALVRVDTVEHFVADMEVAGLYRVHRLS